MRSARFVMYDDDLYTPTLRHNQQSPHTGYRPAKFPTRNIATNIVILYGDLDSLVDIDAMRHELPEHRLDIRRLKGYEHLDVLWGKDIHVDVIPQVAQALRQHCENPEMIRSIADGFKSKDNLLHTDAANGYGSFDGGENGFTSDYATSTDA
jgi:lysosomal acid lipase/cholesteryl ester hydrolase